MLLIKMVEIANCKLINYLVQPDMVHDFAFWVHTFFTLQVMGYEVIVVTRNSSRNKL